MFSGKLLSDLSISHGFFGRDASEIKRDVPLYRPRQVHGTRAIRVSEGDNPEEILDVEADAIWTTDKNIQIAIRTADCVPILVASKDGTVVAAIHAGWRGAVAGIIQETMSDIHQNLGVNPGQIVAAIGPCIDADNFEVGAEVVEAIPAQYRIKSVRYPASEGGKCHVDLGLLCESLLRASGVESVDNLRISTFDPSSDLHSYRRDGKQAGRQLSVIRKK